MGQGKRRIVTVVVGLLFVFGFAIATKYDLYIDMEIHNSENVAAIFMETYGWLPAFLTSVLFFMLLGSQPSISLWRRILFGILAIIEAGILGHVADGYLVRRGLMAERGLIGSTSVFIVIVACVYIYLIKSKSLTKAFRKRLLWFTSNATVYSLIVIGIVNIFKEIWARTRFDDMLVIGNFADFTPWYMPYGNGGNSFPSGHTANSAGILTLIILCDAFPKCKKHKTLISIGCGLYIAFMALTRIIIGRHFLSDTLASGLIATLVFSAVINSQFYKKGLQKVLEESK